MLESALFPFTGGVDELMKDEGFSKHVTKHFLFKTLHPLDTFNSFFYFSGQQQEQTLQISYPQPDENLVGKKEELVHRSGRSQRVSPTFQVLFEK